ncbi:chymotrypsin-like elastase family member 2A isoform X2 [Galleria mellonella]|uniref:Chymotrypsin-like elastase family member 2A isoform X2 n=1 Tax=Galleria mellonella TaxID=7137 RepID=A0ABM3ME36_GALME|nr:chymotrypsin-like elastase family member 2A isoform X2 [Galleria mellonella]
MIRMTIVFFLLAAVNSVPQDRRNWTLLVNPLVSAPPCKGYTNMYMEFEPGLPPDEENSYKVYVNEELPLYSQIKLKFDSEATIILAVFDNYLVGRKGTAHIGLSTPDDGCGRRKVVHTELIVNGQPTKHGDWPWHGAIYRLDSSSLRYICGGTLVSKTYVLTAAHCTTINGVAVLPEILSIIFGKYNLIGGDTDTQERKIHEIIVHAEFNHRKLHNDISLLKLKSEVTFNDFVQPACLWHLNAYKNLPFSTVYGAVVGWGFDHTDKLSPELRQTIIPMVSDSKCIKSNPDFFGKILNNQKFCAGYRNGTSACNGDSGGGFVIFVPDIQGDYSANATGSWFVRGIVSLAIARRDAAICDNTEYTLFTDIAKYGEWIENHMS